MKVPKIIKQNTLMALALLLCCSACYYDNETELYQYADLVPCDATSISYAAQVVAILNTNCNTCHSQDNPLGGNIFLANYTQVKAAVDDGSLYGSITHQATYSPMPNAAQKIADCDISQIKAWIDAGALDN